jgi:VanZ family protein
MVAKFESLSTRGPAIWRGCCIAALVFLVFVGLGPENWQPRSGLGWEVDHFVGYFVLTLMFCFAWPRPLVVAGALIVFAAALEALQALTPDRWSNIWAVFYGACGVVAATLIADLFIRARKRFLPERAQEPSL